MEDQVETLTAHSMTVAGETVLTSTTFQVINPSTGEAFAVAPHATQADVDSAVAAAKAAFASWGATPLSERQQVMLKAHDALAAHSEELVELLVKEQGKPLDAAEAELNLSLQNMKFHATEFDMPTTDLGTNETHKTVVLRKPIGVVAGITPWNFPIFCAVQKWAPAITMGNTFVLKPSPMTPMTSLRIGEILADVFPAGVFNTISGDDTAPFNVGSHLAVHPDVAKVSFTGSTRTGKKIYEAAGADLKRVTLELGGNDPAIVRSDVDIAEAAEGVFEAAFANTGQVCAAIKRVFVHEDVYDEFVKEITANAAKAVTGDGFDQGTKYGPLNNKMQFDRVSELVADALANGATATTGGAPVKNTTGYFFQPTILTDVNDDTRVVAEEQFGPALPIMPYKSDSEAIARANASEYGLSGSVWSKDEDKAVEMANALEAGQIFTNSHGGRLDVPFGGFKHSGIGRVFGQGDIDAFTETQTLQIKLPSKL